MSMHQVAITDKELSYILLALGFLKADANKKGNISLGHEVSSVMITLRNQTRATVES